MSLFEKLQDIEDRYREVGRMLTMPEVVTDAAQLKKYATEHSELEEVVTAYRSHCAVQEGINDNQELLTDPDPEMREAGTSRTYRPATAEGQLEKQIKLLLIPRDPNDSRNVILEVRAGTGGDEAALFAADLFRMYSRYAEINGWSREVLSSNTNDIGGFKEVVALFAGKNVFAKLKYEGGTHRVQRVPQTESQGRIHTSACTVAIMPEAEDVEVDLATTDLRIDKYRASGAGGQHVNKTESAIRITHLPTGLVVQCQDEKSQHKNKAKALKNLKARLYERMLSEQNKVLSSARKSQVGSGDRSERIRTYNYPQNRITDHRVGLTVYKLDQIISGTLDEVIEPVIAYFQAEALRDVS